MISFECKNCGGELELVEPGIGKCSSCHSKQPMPQLNDDKFNRANRLRLEDVNFDDARKLYEAIIDSNPDEAEAYWGIVLCRYGIEYVKDPRTGDYKPTCNRLIESSIKEDSDFKLACEKALNDSVRDFYIGQAEFIDNIQKKIIQIAKNEKPYDIFISFKDKDDDTGLETKDSKKATSLYYALKDAGYNVFFSKITLKEKAGEEYEPLIYAALKSSKVMLLIGTKAEYMNAKWVKNEWRRFNKMRMDGERKLLLPVYEDMDPYEIPYELQALQAMNMGELDFLETLKKTMDSFIGESIESRKEKETEKQIEKMLSKSGIVNSAQKHNDNGEMLLKKGLISDAVEAFDKAIEANPEFYKPYWNRMIIRIGCTEEELPSAMIDFSNDRDYLLACAHAPEEEKSYYEDMARRCRNNKALNAEYISMVQKETKSYCSEDENSGVEKISVRIKLEQSIRDIRAEVEKTICEGPGVAIAGLIVLLLHIAGIVGVFVFGAHEYGSLESFFENASDMYAAVFCILWFTLPITSSIFAGKFTHRGSRGFLAAFFGITFIPAIILIISFMTKIISFARKNSLHKKACKELDDVQSEYKNVLDSIREELDVKCDEIYASYEKKNDNEYFNLNKYQSLDYDKFDRLKRQYFLS